MQFIERMAAVGGRRCSEVEEEAAIAMKGEKAALLAALLAAFCACFWSFLMAFLLSGLPSASTVGTHRSLRNGSSGAMEAPPLPAAGLTGAASPAEASPSARGRCGVGGRCESCTYRGARHAPLPVR